MSNSTTIRSFKPRERCLVNGYLVEVERHARRTSFVRVLDARLPGHVRVQLDKKMAAESVLPGEGGVNESSPARRPADVTSEAERTRVDASSTSPPAGSTET